MTDSVRLHLNGTPDQAVQLLEQTLQPEGFRFTWEAPGVGLAEKGTRTKAMLLGVLATHYKYKVQVYSAPEGTALIELHLGNSGFSGGMVGVAKVRKKLDAVQNLLTAALQSRGLLIGA
ncbi:hypothetical protein [Actinomadura macrotermitis]|uniref:Uncharacterized protein n=1 Tax=Actinomadura macrotermitis TaxID=2585200 RepID=A0A7K0BU91_9ACTN|nr:hypothetical protein [Actinomadura macrotermitis]MQY04773.1 hypothetical protein [Actinomadura macrotermitis]